MPTKPDFAANRASGQRYFNRWKQLTAEGVKPVVISRQGNPQEWSAWLAYFRAHGLATSVDLMLDKHEKTVPCLHPVDFEPQVFIEADRRWRDD